MLQFWRGGYAGTSIDDLAEASGASRATLYAHFGDKRALFIQSLGLYAGRFAERVSEALSSEASAAKALRSILEESADRLARVDGPQGCLRCHATLNLQGLDPGIDVAIDAANAAYLANMQRIIDVGVEFGELSLDQSEGMAHFLTAIVGGLVVSAKGGADRAALIGIVDRAMAFWSPETKGPHS